MNILGLEITIGRKAATLSLDQLIRRIEAVYETQSGIQVTPETAMQSPTVHAIVTAISRRISTLPVHVQRKTMSNDRERRELLPSHPITRLLQSPNDFQDRVSFWSDAASWLVRYGNFYAFKSRGLTGPVRQLVPIPAGEVEPKQASDLTLTYEATLAGGGHQEFEARQIMHARTAARDGFKGNSPIMDVREAIALEIAAEQMGSSLFGNYATPGMILKFAQWASGFKTDEERDKFRAELDAAFTKKGRFKTMVLPKGLELADQAVVDNDKAQFLGTRQYQRSTIAGAFGVPLHLVGDLSKGTFNNVEEQNRDFVLGVVLPYVRVFEAAMEKALLTQEDRNSGVIIRFNLDAALRANFKERQEGLQIQRQNGVINANEWREREGMNPISEEDGGNEFWRQGPSGQSADPPVDDDQGTDDDEQDDDEEMAA